MRDDACFCPKCGRAQDPLAPDTPQENKINTIPQAPESQAASHKDIAAQLDAYLKADSTPVAVAEPEAVAESETPSPVVSADKVRAAVAGLIRSPLFLIATIAFTLLQLLYLPGLFEYNINLGIISYLDPLFNVFDILFRVDSYYFYQPFYGFIGQFSYFLMLLFNLLTVAGLWLTYATAGQKGQNLRTGGLTLLKISAIANLVLNGLLCVVASFSALMAIVELPFIYALVYVGAAVFLVILLVIEVIFTVKICTSLSTVKRSIVTGIADHRASVLVAIVCFLKLGWNILSSLTYLLDALRNGYLLEYLVEFPVKYYFIDIFYLVIFILFGVLIFLYRKKMSPLKNAPAEEV